MVDALSQLALLALFVIIVWILLLIAGRQAALAHAKLREELTSWAGHRRWIVGTERGHLLAPAVGAEEVVEYAHGVVGGYDCTILYCTAFESSFVACALRLPGGSGHLALRRRRPGRSSRALTRAVTLLLGRPRYHPGLPEPAVYDQDFDRSYRVVDAAGRVMALLSPPVRRALARAAATAPVKEVRIVDDLVMIKAETWTVPGHLDALVDALAALAQAAQPGPAPD